MSDPDAIAGQPRHSAPARDGDAVLTRSEEQLEITTQRRAVRARLVKYTETETRSITVPVRREQARVEYEPLAAGVAEPVHQKRGRGRDDERWLVLYDEEVVVQTRWVAREQVRLSTFSVDEDLQISESLRSERIDVDVDVDDTTRHTED
jgi:uncharacterized protein (TIGR02271 family)